MLNLTSFQQDLLKIALDRGFLALIAVLFGWYLSRLADRYRAGHAYFGVLAQKRIEAYQTLAELLGVQVAAVSGLLFVLQEERRSPSSSAEDSGEKLEAAYRDFVASHERTKAPLIRNSILLTKEVADALNTCQTKIEELINTFYEAPIGGARPEQLFDLSKEVNLLLSRMLERMAEEIHRYDYK